MEKNYSGQSSEKYKRLFTQTGKIMKLFTVFTFVAMLQVTAKGYSHNVNLTAPSSDITLEKTFQPSSGSSLRDIKITGLVADSATGQPLPGVTIIVKDENTGVVTDAKGRFALKVPADAVLQVRLLGYSSKEIHVQGKKVFDIFLTP